MKRVQSACLSQTIHFQLKEDLGHDLAVRHVKEEYENYKKQLERNKTKYKIIDEKAQDDGSIIVKVKKQVIGYDVGNYLE